MSHLVGYLYEFHIVQTRDAAKNKGSMSVGISLKKIGTVNNIHVSTSKGGFGKIKYLTRHANRKAN